MLRKESKRKGAENAKIRKGELQIIDDTANAILNQTFIEVDDQRQLQSCESQVGQGLYSKYIVIFLRCLALYND